MSEFATPMTNRQKAITLVAFALAPICNIFEPLLRDLLWPPIFSISSIAKENPSYLRGAWLYFDVVGLLLLPTAIAFDTEPPSLRFKKMKERSRRMRRSVAEILIIAYLFFLPMVILLGWLMAWAPPFPGGGWGGELFRYMITYQLGFYTLVPLFAVAYAWSINVAILLIIIPALLITSRI